MSSANPMASGRTAWGRAR